MILPANLKSLAYQYYEEPDSPSVYVPMEVAQPLFENPGTINGVDLELTNPYQAQRSKRPFRKASPQYEWTSCTHRNAAEFNGVAQDQRARTSCSS